MLVDWGGSFIITEPVVSADTGLNSFRQWRSRSLPRISNKWNSSTVYMPSIVENDTEFLFQALKLNSSVNRPGVGAGMPMRVSVPKVPTFIRFGGKLACGGCAIS